MYAVKLGIFIIVPVLQLISFTESQCPENFRYFRNETTGEIMGIVEIPSPPQGVALHLRIILSIATVLPTKYAGKIELAKSKEESVRSVINGLPLYYRIYFPVRNPIPVVSSITLNNVHYCSGPPANGMIVTNILLEHTLFPPRVIIPLTEQLLNLLSNHTTTSLPIPEDPIKWHAPEVPQEKTTTMVPSTTSKISPLAQTSESKPVDSSCGLTSDFDTLIANPEATSPIMWPWLAAIFLFRYELDFQCTGNLISKDYVMTAAHCLKEDDESAPTEMLLVSLGRFDLRDIKEPGSVNVGVASYKIHPDYKDSGSADSDLAIIKLIRRIEFTPNIRPVCLWMGETELDAVVGKYGYVIGWSIDGRSRKLLPEPRMSRVPIVSQEECRHSNLDFNGVISNRTFCAGRKDGTGPCANDSGSGLIMYHARYKRYHLRGMVSFSLVDIRTRSCDLKEYVVYVDIAKYLTWIRREMIS